MANSDTRPAELVFKPKVDWWIYAVVAVGIGGCLIGPLLDGDNVAGYILAAGIAALYAYLFTGMRYVVRGDRLGVRAMYRWHWYPVGKIKEVRKTRGIVAAASLSLDRVSVTFTDRSVLKSSEPLAVGPKDADGFIAALRAANPAIAVK